MRALNRTLALVSVLLAGGAISGCGSDIASKVMCAKDIECQALMGTLLEPDAAVGTFPQCCAGFCMIPSLGCDTGYRYLTVDPNNAPGGGFGKCVAAPSMCMPPDLGTGPVDMAQSQSD